MGGLERKKREKIERRGVNMYTQIPYFVYETKSGFRTCVVNANLQFVNHAISYNPGQCC